MLASCSRPAVMMWDEVDKSRPCWLGTVSRKIGFLPNHLSSQNQGSYWEENTIFISSWRLRKFSKCSKVQIHCMVDWVSSLPSTTFPAFEFDLIKPDQTDLIETEVTGQRLVKSHIVARSMAITDWSVLGHKEIAQRIDWIHLQIVSYIQAVVLGNLCVKEIKILYGYPAWNPGATILIDLSCLNVWRWCMLNNKHYSL